MTATLAEEDVEVEKPQTPQSSYSTAPQQRQTLQIQEPSQETTYKPQYGDTRPNHWKIWRKWTTGSDTSWWFASTGIPLLAAALGPLANVSSISALVTSWRQNNYLDGGFVSDLYGVPYADPRWCYWLNVVSLICGFLGNLFLLFNFTQKIRYIIALPATIAFWYISSGLLMAITACMEVYTPPTRPYEGYTQGYWYAVAAAALYFICSVLLMVNMLGYYLGHYPDHFALSDSQRTLILQTMFFFVWIAGGAAMYSRIQTDAGEHQWTFTNSLYFCYVTILTVGFGDLVATTDLGRGLLFPYSVGGIITLGLIVSSLYRAARELGEDHIVQKDVRRRREQALQLTVTDSQEYKRREHRLLRRGTFGRLKISGPSEPRPYRTIMSSNERAPSFPLNLTVPLVVNRKPRLLLLKEEKDRFDAMRKIQADSKRFKRWMALIWSVTTFLILWCVGAAVFWKTEQDIQDMTYFQALYFCYISLLTIGYGDLSPKSNPGRCFFVIWSLISVPTMTVLVSNLSDTVVAKFKKWSNLVADFTVLPKRDIWQPFVAKNPWLQQRIEDHKAKGRIREGFVTADPEAGSVNNSDDNDVEAASDAQQAIAPNIQSLAAEAEIDVKKAPTQASLSRRIALSIKKVSLDLRLDTPKCYSYEEWVEFTRLIRYTTPRRLNRVLGTNITSETENEEGLVNWDWLGEHSPMVAGVSESEWLLERLVESLIRLEKRREIACDHGDIGEIRDMEVRPPLLTPSDVDHSAGNTTPAPPS